MASPHAPPGFRGRNRRSSDEDADRGGDAATKHENAGCTSSHAQDQLPPRLVQHCPAGARTSRRAVLSIHLASSRVSEAEWLKWFQNTRETSPFVSANTTRASQRQNIGDGFTMLSSPVPLPWTPWSYLDRGIVRALGALREAERHTLLQGLRRLIGEAPSAAYVLGDYRPVVWPSETADTTCRFKDNIEKESAPPDGGAFRRPLETLRHLERPRTRPLRVPRGEPPAVRGVGPPP